MAPGARVDGTIQVTHPVFRLDSGSGIRGFCLVREEAFNALTILMAKQRRSPSLYFLEEVVSKVFACSEMLRGG